MSQNTILIVDDSMMVRRIVSQLLKESGFDVLLAENGEQALQVAREQAPDLILMDLEMPIMDGFAATRELKNDPATAAIPVLIFTSLGSEEDLIRAQQTGCQGIMNKPICKVELRKNILEILNPGGE